MKRAQKATKENQPSNVALYRKYRPHSFNEVEGQDQVVKVLESSIRAEKVSHAYLFVGTRGTGKTSVARIFASEIGVSENDLYEIDAASNRGIEDIKTLREGARTLPFDSKYKIYIIDEVHMLSKDAWGALLKILEEPPRHVIFILATTELHKVPETIISRCQVFNFRKPNEVILKKVILDVSKKEGLEIEADGAELMASLGDGSFRDTLGVLQKVINFYLNESSLQKNKNVKKISREDVEKITGAPKATLVNDFLKALVSKNIEEGITIIKKASSENLDMKLYIKLIIQKFRMALILRHAPNLHTEMGEDFGENDISFLKDLIKEDQTGVIRSSSLSILLESYQNIDRAFISELPLELGLIKILSKE